MHIKDLKLDIELDRAALAVIRGGSSSEIAQAYPWGSKYQGGMPVFNGDSSWFRTEVMGSIGAPKLEAPVVDLPSLPGIGTSGGPL